MPIAHAVRVPSCPLLRSVASSIYDAPSPSTSPPTLGCVRSASTRARYINCTIWEVLSATWPAAPIFGPQAMSARGNRVGPGKISACSQGHTRRPIAQILLAPAVSFCLSVASSICDIPTPLPTHPFAQRVSAPRSLFRPSFSDSVSFLLPDSFRPQKESSLTYPPPTHAHTPRPRFA